MVMAQAPAPAVRQSAAVPINHAAGLQVVDGELWGGGDDYKVRFEPGGFVLTPALGRRAPRNYPLALRVESIGRGQTLSPLASRSPRFTELRVEYDRGVAVERYDLLAAGMEQSFVFATRPAGSGDLVVRARLTTDLQVSADGDGLRFDLPGVGGFRMGGVVGIDAHGVRVRGGLRYEAGILELSLPDAFVDRAALPLTLDPLIGAFVRVTPAGGDNDRAPVVAFEATANVYLAVWTRIFSATDLDVHGQRVSRSGGLVGARLLIENSTAFEYEPQITSCNLRGAFVVVYTRDPGNIIARTVNGATGAVSAFITVAASSGSFHSGTVANMRNASHVVCVWQSDSDSTLQARRILVSTNLTLSLGATNTLATGASVPPGRPRLAKSDRGTGRLALVYERQFGGSNPLVRPYLMILNDVPAPLAIELAVNTSDRFDQGFPEVDGDGTTWLVVWEASSHDRVDTDAICKSFTYDATNRTVRVNSPPSEVRARLREQERLPSVFCTGGSCVTGWMEQFTSVPDIWTPEVRSVDPFRCTDCEGVFSLDFVNAVSLSPVGCSVDAGGGQGEEALLVWETASATASSNGDIIARLWRAADGAVTSLGGGCGAGGTNHATCARSPNRFFTHRLRGATPSTAAVFVLSGLRRDFSCGACTLIPDVATAILIPLRTDAAGEAAVFSAIPASSELIGVPLLTQWATVDLAPRACALFHFDLSNALRVVVEG